MLPLVSILAGAALAQVAPEHTAQVVDRVVVVVGDTVITSSNVRATVALETRDQTLAGDLLEPKTAPVQRLIDGAIIRQLAGDVPVYQPTPGQVRARMEALRNTWSDPRDYHRFMAEHGLDEARLFAQMFSRFVIDAYIHRNLSRSVTDSPEDLAAKRDRYLAWIAPHRASTRIRHVAAQENP